MGTWIGQTAGEPPQQTFRMPASVPHALAANAGDGQDRSKAIGDCGCVFTCSVKMSGRE